MQNQIIKKTLRSDDQQIGYTRQGRTRNPGNTIKVKPAYRRQAKTDLVTSEKQVDWVRTSQIVRERKSLSLFFFFFKGWFWACVIVNRCAQSKVRWLRTRQCVWVLGSVVCGGYVCRPPCVLGTGVQWLGWPDNPTEMERNWVFRMSSEAEQRFWSKTKYIDIIIYKIE